MKKRLFASTRDKKSGTELRLRAKNAEEKLAESKPADSEEDNL